MSESTHTALPSPIDEGTVAGENPLLPVLATAFLAHLGNERCVSAHTLDGYRRDLSALAQWMRDNRHPDISTLIEPDLRAFIACEHRRGLSPPSLQRRLSACRSLYRWLLAQGRVTANPAANLRAPRVIRKLPEVLDPDEAKVLVEIPTDAPLGLRDRALLELLYSSGLRVSELCQLRWRDLDLAEGLVSVFGKGQRQRLVPIGSHARRALEKWRADTDIDDDAWVFPGRHGNAITSRAIQIRIRTLAQHQGIYKRVYPHLMRHSFASHVLESSGDLRGVQELLGHADISTTQIYTHLDFGHLAKVYDAAHPRAKRRNT